MKTLIIVRHAKSSWADIGQKDFDRPLNERGKKDAPEMAEKLLDTKINVDAFVSSPAKRARKTAKYFIEAFGKTKEEIILKEELYNAPASIFYKTVAALSDQYETVAMFAHNPGITEFANSLCAKMQVTEMPTCAVFAVQIPIESWKSFETAEKEFLFFKYPKES